MERPVNEINYLLNLLEKFLKEKANKFSEKYKTKIIGKKNFSKKLNKLLIEAEKTHNNKKLQINLALNYGSKDELINAVKHISKKKEKINQKILKNIFLQKICQIQIF